MKGMGISWRFWRPKWGFHTHRMMLVAALWVFGMSPAVVASSGAQGRANVVLDPYLATWPTEPPMALHADRTGPFWVVREGSELILRRFREGRAEQLRRFSAPSGYPPFAFLPRLVQGGAEPEILYRSGEKLVAEGESSLADALGRAHWEYYSAARLQNTLFVAAFGIQADGISRIGYFHRGQAPIVTELRPSPVGVWAPVALLSGSRAIVVYRGRMVGPGGRGYGLLFESMARIDLVQTGVWSPSRSQAQPSERGFYYGDPTACLDDGGALHWAAVIWNRDDQPTGRVVVDGMELDVSASSQYWLPSLRYVSNLGLVLGIEGGSGKVEIGLVNGASFEVLASLPGSTPRLAARGASFYVATSEGMWGYFVAEPVGNWSPWSLICAAFFIILISVSRCRNRRPTILPGS